MLSPDIVDAKGRWSLWGSCRGPRSFDDQTIFVGLFFPEVNDTDDRFYRLKKDSQRRQTIDKVLRNDRSLICNLWHDSVVKEMPNGEECHLTQVLLTVREHFLCFGQQIVLNGGFFP